jgi:hypothetical protein
LTQHLELLVGPFILSRETQELEEECSAARVRRIIPDFGTQSLQRVR